MEHDEPLRQLADAGAHVVLSGRTREAMDASRKAIEAAGGRATAVVAEMRDVQQVQGLVDRAVNETGRLDIMVNNAGVSFPRPIVSGDPEEWRAMLETNILALLVGCQAAVRAMARTSSTITTGVPVRRAICALLPVSSSPA